MSMRFICTDDSLLKGPSQLIVGKCYQIGRSSKCSFVLSQMSVSRVHAELEICPETFLVKDLKSRNGTFVDGDKVEQAELKPGQSVQFGSVMFQLVNGETPADLDEDAMSHASTFIVSAGPKAPSAKLLAQLSEAQRRVLELLKKGQSEKIVASRLDLSTHTVHNHVKAIYKKLHVRSRSEMLALFVAEDNRPQDRS